MIAEGYDVKTGFCGDYCKSRNPGDILQRQELVFRNPQPQIMQFLLSIFMRLRFLSAILQFD